MVWYVQPMQLKNENGMPSGKWRLIARSDEGGGFHECTQKTFDSPEAAASDPESQKEASLITGMPNPEELNLVNTEAKYKKVCLAANQLLSALNEFTHPGLSSEQLASAVQEDYERLVLSLLEVKELWMED